MIPRVVNGYDAISFLALVVILTKEDFPTLGYPATTIVGVSGLIEGKCLSGSLASDKKIKSFETLRRMEDILANACFLRVRA
jgi:hypothetical protein